MNASHTLLFALTVFAPGVSASGSHAGIPVGVENGIVITEPSPRRDRALGMENRRTSLDTTAARIGIYFDPKCQRSVVDNPPFGTPFRAWLAFKGVTSARQWYGRVLFPSGMTVLSSTLKPPGSSNSGSANNWIVTLPSCASPDSNGNLLVVEYLLRIDGPCSGDSVCGGNQCSIRITSTVSPLRLPGWVDCAWAFHATQYQDTGVLGGCVTSGDPPVFLGTPAGNPSSGPVPLTVHFDAYAYDTDPVQYYWYFGDGGFMSGTGASGATHTFTEPGSYLVWVNAFDGDNDASAYISVNARVAAVEGPRRPGAFRLEARANPFTSTTTLAFETKQPGHVDLEIFDAGGRLVGIALSEWMTAGPHTVHWSRSDGSGHRLPAGVYVVRMRAGALSQSLRIVAID